MPRINTRPSNIPSSRYGTATPAPEGGSDQENRDPAGQTRDRGKQRAMPPPSSHHQRSSLPTPTSDGSESRGQKRKRVTLPPSSTQDGGEDDEEEDEEFTKYFDPNQDPEVRRQLKKKARDLERDFQENREELLRGATEGLRKTVNRANNLFQKVKQTTEATLDSRLLVNVVDLAYKKTTQLAFGDTSTGIDVDEFLSKCITYMRNGGPANREEDGAASGSRRQPGRRHAESDDEDDDAGGEVLDWEVLGRTACFPYNTRPPVPSFLLGPLSVEKKQRTQTQRRARLQKDTAGREARPEALTREDLQQSDENGLTAICTRIRKHLAKHQNEAERGLTNDGYDPEDEERSRALLKKHRLASNGCVPLFDYVLNPRSFGQSVENLFYISFLIKEGSVGVDQDDTGMPTLVISNPTSLQEQRTKKTTRRQAVFSIDYGTWQQLIEAFDIREPMIPHRQDEQQAQVGERGWYT
ncbi:hypothetical protein LTR86_004352 [Recurvomyces mirabilis]|nr:hypothetical protein LTR86_004352 [Recurvomyces mirabilis]